MSALRLINETEFSGVNVNAVDIPNIFSADFDIYKIVIKDLVYDSPAYLYARFLNSAGSTITSASYDSANLLMDSGSTWTENRSTGATAMRYLEYFGSGTLNSSVNTLYIFNPYSSSSYTFVLNQGWGHFGTRGNGAKSIFVLKTTDVVTGFQLVTQTTGVYLQSGFIRTYGLRVDNG